MAGVRSAVAAVVALGLLAACGVATPVGPRNPGELRWKLVRDVPVTRGSAFTGISAAGARAVFAVGFREGGLGTPVALRWDGSRWSAITKGLPRSGFALEQVAAASATDVWAFGSDTPCCGHRLYRWQGTSWIGQQMARDAAPGSVRLAVAPGGVWLTYRKGEESLVRYWDGRRWRERPLPPADRRAQVAAAATSAGGMAVVTAAFYPGPDQASTRRGTITHVLRWQNGAWHRLSLPTDVGAVAATSPAAMWAAGTTCVNPAVREVKLGLWDRQCTGGRRSWIRRWDGTAWRPARLPPGIPAGLTFKEFTGQAPGVLLLTATPQGGDPVRLWYDGRRWSRATGDQDPDRTCAEVRGISPVPGTTALVAAGGGAGQAQGACIAVTGPLRTG